MDINLTLLGGVVTIGGAIPNKTIYELQHMVHTCMQESRLTYPHTYTHTILTTHTSSTSTKYQ